MKKPEIVATAFYVISVKCDHAPYSRGEVAERGNVVDRENYMMPSQNAQVASVGGQVCAARPRLSDVAVSAGASLS